MTRYSIPMVLVVSACARPSAEAANETIVTIETPATCPECRIEFREVAMLGGEGDPASVRADAASRGCSVGRLETGEYVLTSTVGGGALQIYGADGEFERSIGHSGEGPGEFGSLIRLAVGPGDTLYVMDDSQARVQVMMPDGEFVRSFQSRGRFRSFALLATGDLLMHRTPRQSTDPLFYVLNGAGEEMARFGQATMEAIDLETWIVSPAVPKGFWAASIWKYEVHRYSSADSIARIYVREADWFPAGGVLPEGMYETVPPPPTLDHIHEDESHRLWTFSWVPDADWKSGVEMEQSPEWYRRTFDTVVEVVDLETSSLIAHDRYDSILGMMCGNDLMYTVVETAMGDTRVQILEPMLVEPD